MQKVIGRIRPHNNESGGGCNANCEMQFVRKCIGKDDQSSESSNMSQFRANFLYLSFLKQISEF